VLRCSVSQALIEFGENKFLVYTIKVAVFLFQHLDFYIRKQEQK